MTYSYILDFAKTFDNVTRHGYGHTMDVLQIVPAFEETSTDLCILNGAQSYLEDEFESVSKNAVKIAFPSGYDALLAKAKASGFFEIFNDGVYSVVAKE